MRTVVVIVLAAFVVSSGAAAQSSLTVGDEVVFSGGPSQPPQSRQTGMKLEVKMRGGGALQPGPTGARQGAPDPGPSAAAAAAVPPPLPDMSGWSLADLSSALGDPDASRRMAAAEALGRTESGPTDRISAARTLVSALGDREPRVVCRALASLGALRVKASVPEVLKTVSLGDDRTAVQAILALQAVGDRSVVPELEKVARRDGGPVGQAAREAIAALSRPDGATEAPIVEERTGKVR